jgi:hypothetical protein
MSAYSDCLGLTMPVGAYYKQPGYNIFIASIGQNTLQNAILYIRTLYYFSLQFRSTECTTKQNWKKLKINVYELPKSAIF